MGILLLQMERTVSYNLDKAKIETKLKFNFNIIHDNN